MTTRRQFTQVAAATAVLGALPGFVQAQGMVDTLRIIVGFPPGGTTDAFARRMAEKLRGVYATNVVVDNKPGAGGQVGVITLRDAPADGTVMLFTPGSMITIYPIPTPSYSTKRLTCCLSAPGCTPHLAWASALQCPPASPM